MVDLGYFHGGLEGIKRGPSAPPWLGLSSGNLGESIEEVWNTKRPVLLEMTR